MAGHSKWAKVKHFKGAIKMGTGGGEMANFEIVHKKIEAKDIKCEAAEIMSLPALTTLCADPATLAAVNKLIEALEEHDDVKEVFSNAEFFEEAVKA